MPWHRRHPHDVSRDQWVSWLRARPLSSPYLLPEWSLYWESVWNKCRAELWVHTDQTGYEKAAIPLVRRRRFGLEFCYAQPYGTTCGPIGDADAIRIASEADFASYIAGPHAVEMGWVGDQTPGANDQWIVSTRNVGTWVIDIPENAESLQERIWSESHRRNVVRGRNQDTQLKTVSTPQDARTLISAWSASVRSSRLVLNKARAPKLLSAFAQTDALMWWSCWSGSRSIATFAFLVFDRCAVYVDGAVDRDPRYAGVGHYLYSEILQDIAKRGVKRIELGGGPLGRSTAGLDQFKRGWGAREQTRTVTLFRRIWYDRMRRFLGRR